jgi:glycine oxidase
MSPPPDVIVIGAGIVGCTVAHELARRGASVQVVDGRAAGMGATQASAGILAPYIEAREENPLFDFAVRSLDLYDDFVARVTSESGLPVEYRRTGTLHVATCESTMRELRATADLLTRRGVGAELLDGAAARLEEPQLADEILGGLVIGIHGFVAPGSLTSASAAAAIGHGAQFLEHSRVTRIARDKSGLRIDTDRGTLRAGAVVLAAGSWSGSIDADALVPRIQMTPVRGQLLHLAWHGPRIRRIVWTPSCYLVPWDDGTVLVGATIEHAGFEERTTVAGVRQLLEAACAVTPNAATAGFSGARVGLRPGTADDLPIIGASSMMPDVMYATGHYRNGVLLSPITAQLVANALLEKRVDPALAVFSPARFGG